MADGDVVYIHFLIHVLAQCMIVLCLYLIFAWREKKFREQYRDEFMREHREELEKLAYRDVVTGVSNRNRYEQELQSLDVSRICAVSTVSINHGEYLQQKYGNTCFEELLKQTAQILRETVGEETSIYRLSENLFGIWFFETVELEDYILRIKEEFRRIPQEEADLSSLAVGAVYHDRVLKEEYSDLFRRCEDMRLLDQKHEEIKFMNRKIQYINAVQEN